MDSSIRTTLWAAYAALILLVTAGLAVTVGILQSANRQDYRVVEGSAPLLQTMNSMDDDVMTMLAALIGVAVILIAAYLVSRVQQSLASSIARQVRRTEAMIGGMNDGVMLVDEEGKTVFLNPAAQALLGRNDTGVPIFRQAET